MFWLCSGRILLASAYYKGLQKSWLAGTVQKSMDNQYTTFRNKIIVMWKLPRVFEYSEMFYLVCNSQIVRSRMTISYYFRTQLSEILPFFYQNFHSNLLIMLDLCRTTKGFPNLSGTRRKSDTGCCDVVDTQTNWVTAKFVVHRTV